MPCCKNSGFDRPCKEKVVYTDSDSKEYCIFHTPAYRKLISVEEFNRLVFEKILNTPKGKTCSLDGFVFSGKICFSSFGEKNPFPDVSFMGVTFNEHADFCRVHFSGAAIFHGVTFREGASFKKAVFDGSASFSRSTFGKATTSFSEAVFLEASFSHAVFYDAVDFSGAGVVEKANFQRTSFVCGADFSLTLFGKVDFREAKFHGPTKFVRTIFYIDGQFAGSTVEGRVRFEDVDMFNVSFLDAEAFRTEAEVEFMDFVNCRWPRERMFLDYLLPRKDKQFRGRYRVNDEPGCMLTCTMKGWDYWPPWSEVESLYRKLKQKAIEANDKHEAIRWYYCEKESCRKKYSFGGFFRAWYWHGVASGYGLFPGRAAMVFLCLLVGVTLLMGWIGLKPRDLSQQIGAILSGYDAKPQNLLQLYHDIMKSHQVSLSNLNWEKMFILIRNTFQNVFFVKNLDFVPLVPVPWEFVQTAVTKVLIPLQFLLFLSALLNRFRKYYGEDVAD